jgi:hypothetical protein
MMTEIHIDKDCNYATWVGTVAWFTPNGEDPKEHRLVLSQLVPWIEDENVAHQVLFLSVKQAKRIAAGIQEFLAQVEELDEAGAGETP